MASKVRIQIEITADDAREQARIIQAIGGDFDKFRAAVLKVSPGATFDFDVVKVRKQPALRVSPAEAESPAELDIPRPAAAPPETGATPPPWKRAEQEAA